MTQQKKYQENLSTITPILLNKDYKRPKVEKMLAILDDAGALDKHDSLAVDVGCSAGFFTKALASHFTRVIGLDIDESALEKARKESSAENVAYQIGDSMKLPFADATVDLIICNHVYEHVPDAGVLFHEIKRVLKPDGICYLGAASRLTPIEPHYHLPFLSWLPKSIADRYMKLTGKGEEYYEKLQTYWGIRRLIADFKVEDYTLRVIENPDLFKARDMLPENGFLAKIPDWIWRSLYVFLPSYLFILRKH
jgi:SAM-dependent methyltransferase